MKIIFTKEDLTKIIDESLEKVQSTPEVKAYLKIKDLKELLSQNNFQKIEEIFNDSLNSDDLDNVLTIDSMTKIRIEIE